MGGMMSDQPTKFSTQGIRDHLVVVAYEHGLFNLLLSFFHRVTISWGTRVQTAAAYVLDGKPHIMMNPHFFDKHVKTKKHAVEILLHEILHHVLKHLLIYEELVAQGFSPFVMNVAEDAIINAALHKMGCGEFFRHFYKDKMADAFLRSGSVVFAVEKEGREIPLKEANPDMYTRCHEFYKKLYEQKISLEAALTFFNNLQEEANASGIQFLGSHEQSGKDDDPIFSKEFAMEVLRTFGLEPATSYAHEQLKKVVQQITSASDEVGPMAGPIILRRKFPVKLKRGDYFRTEQDVSFYHHRSRVQRLVHIFPDISGSLDRHRHYTIDLVNGLMVQGIDVRIVVWADEIRQVLPRSFAAGKFPKVGTGTIGEEVAQYIAKKKISQAVIISDNDAGEIRTSLPNTTLYLCLIGQKKTGSFAEADVRRFFIYPLG